MRYALSRRVLHWAVFALLVVQFPLGWIMAGYEPGTVAAVDGALGEGAFNTLYDLHKSIGLTILGLMILRVVARATRPAPPHAPPIKPWEARASLAVHLALYGLLIVTPIVGWIGVSLFPAPAPLFFLVDLRLPFAADRPLSESFLEVHAPLAAMILILAAVHVLAALKHRFIDRDLVMDRML